ncbi:hypothetical protein ACJD0Z_18340 [Flavobacteriaceae bacterium M23B6Z8]
MRIARIKLIILGVVILVLVTTTCKAQKVSDSVASPVGTWYYYNMSNELGSCIISYRYLIFDANIEQEENSFKDTIVVKEVLSRHRMIVYNPGKKPSFASVRLEVNDEGNLLTFFPVVEGESIEEVKQKMTKDSVPIWKDLTGRLFLSEEKLASLKKAPGLDEITREDMITSLQWREELGKKLQAFVTDMKGERQYMVYRFVREYQKQKLIELGYNPYKQVSFNWEEQFKDDPEVLKLLTEPISFD